MITAFEVQNAFSRCYTALGGPRFDQSNSEFVSIYTIISEILRSTIHLNKVDHFTSYKRSEIGMSRQNQNSIFRALNPRHVHLSSFESLKL